jgi:hypothetical protein
VRKRRSHKQKKKQEVELGGGEYVLSENQILVTPEGVQYKSVKYLGQGTFG